MRGSTAVPGATMATTRTLLTRILGIALLILVSAPVAAVLLSLQRGADIIQQPSLDPDDIARVEQLLVESAPGDIRTSELRRLSLSNEELNLLLRYASELVGVESGINGRIQLPGRTLQTIVSVPVTTPLKQLWLNLRAEFISDGARLQLTSLSLGHLRIPGSLVKALAARVENQFLGDSTTYKEIVALLESVQRIEIAEDRLDLDFMWEPSLLGQFRSQAQQLLVSDSDQLRIARHYRQLVRTIETIPPSSRAIPLSALLAPMFASALEQSAAGSDPVAENRTLLIALAAYVNEEDIDRWLRSQLADQLPEPRLIEVRIQRRKDLAQHVISSAAIAASAGAGIAQVLSSFKESYDARYRTGYSFSDLTANSAGMLLGQIATSSQESAVEMQRRLSTLKSDSEYLPELTNSPDGLSESDFNALYGQQGSDQYRSRIQEIELLILQQPLFSGISAL